MAMNNLLQADLLWRLVSFTTQTRKLYNPRHVRHLLCSSKKQFVHIDHFGIIRLFSSPTLILPMLTSLHRPSRTLITSTFHRRSLPSG